MVEREHTSVRLAVDRLLDSFGTAPLAPGDVRLSDVRAAAERLSGTYLIRLFAEFEFSLRVYWEVARGRDSPARTRDLLNGVGAFRRMPFDTIADAHAVRECRNGLIHHGDQSISGELSLAQARRRLCIFLSFLPREW